MNDYFRITWFSPFREIRRPSDTEASLCKDTMRCVKRILVITYIYHHTVNIGTVYTEERESSFRK